MNIHPVDQANRAILTKQLLSKAMPPNSLGRLGSLSIELGLMGAYKLEKLTLLLFAADHGIVSEGVTHSAQEITWQQCVNFANGGGACALFSSLNQVDLTVIDVGVNHRFCPTDKVVDAKVAFGSQNFLRAPALEESACRKAIEEGRNAVLRARAKGCDAIAFGEMGVGNTTSASAVAAALLGLHPSLLTGKGSGLSDEELEHKIGVIEQALLLHPQRDPFSVLCNLGGYESAAICGGLWQAAELGLPILLDGFVVSSAALVAARMEPNLVDYLIPCHRSAMSGHQLMLDALGGKKPLLELDMQLGEGTGALAAWPLVRLASHILPDMTSFSLAKVTDSTAVLQDLGLV
ncbi:MAG: nicotinate-nucleotide--dimethylbenzimidazole phosphoribosyltransferase [Sphaerochaeta sp.]|nr:nicotinate-nucleotide--dimethylbenzimidazole phosphoribosyltransferase [Sphaerochaeta sp.]